MTLVVDPLARPEPGPPPLSAVRRLWDAPVWGHLLALAVILLALVPLVGTGASLSADEGAAIIQAQSLERGDGWVIEHPAPNLDPTGARYPLELAEQGSAGRAPFAKHPVYALALAAADRLGGVTAMVLLSLAGTLAAAGFAAGLARRIDPSLSRPTIWVVGLASPLLFDGFLVIAHTLGAAAATGAVLLAVVAIERRRLLVALGVIPCLGLAVLLRNEAVFFALGLAAAAGLVALRSHSRARLAALLVATASLVAAVGARLGERLWIRRIVGAVVAPVASATGAAPTGSQDGLLSSRVRSFLLTWLRPSYTGPRQLTLALSAMVVAAAVGAYVARRHPDDRGTIAVAASVAAVTALFALAVGPTNIVPGLLVAFPLMLVGLLLIRRSQLQATAAQLGLATFAVFAIAVLATQYENGGSGEWGGRYFALGLPVLVPVLLLALRDAGRTLTPATRGVAAASLATVTVVMAVMGIASLRHHHEYTAALVTSMERAGEQAAADQPVLVTTSGAPPRFAWRTFDRQRWLLTTPADLPALERQLAQSGVARFVFVTNALERDGPALAGLDIVSRRGAPDGTGYQVLVVSRPSSNPHG